MMAKTKLELMWKEKYEERGQRVATWRVEEEKDKSRNAIGNHGF